MGALKLIGQRKVKVAHRVNKGQSSQKGQGLQIWKVLIKNVFTVDLLNGKQIKEVIVWIEN